MFELLIVAIILVLLAGAVGIVVLVYKLFSRNTPK